jgi:histidinol-phosphate phosphatase family protein
VAKEAKKGVEQRRKRAVFLDRDGTIMPDLGYLRDPEQVSLLPGAGAALALLQRQGFYLVLVSNQSGVGRGIINATDLERVHQRLLERLAEYSIRLDGAYYCCHAPWESCDCRKPFPGLLLQAANELELDLPSSFMVGDKPGDMEAAKRLGCISILLASAPTLDPITANADVVAKSWHEIPQHILGRHPDDH